MDDLITYEVEGKVATITMHRPEKRNALSAGMVTGLRAAFGRAADDAGVRVIVLTGAGRVFSAGADLAALKALQTATPMDNLADSAHLSGLFAEIYGHPKPVIAKVNGHAIAGGCGLAAVCDFAIAADGARFGFTEVRIGFVPAIVMVFILRKLGETAARDLFLRGHLVTAEEAVRVGLITRAVEEGELDSVVATVASEIATETSPSAIQLTKQMLAQVPGMGFGEALHYAAQMNALARGTVDCRDGIAAFLQKTPPPWKLEGGT